MTLVGKSNVTYFLTTGQGPVVAGCPPTGYHTLDPWFSLVLLSGVSFFLLIPSCTGMTFRVFIGVQG